jgi:uncharacterized membrane protein YccF (DUF307 family)
MVEETVIRGLWFGRGSASDTYSKFSVPIFVLLPYGMAIAAAFAVRKLTRKGQIERTTAGRIQHTMAFLVFGAYLALQELARVAFH